MAALEGNTVVTYNCGEVVGASRSHKHLQLLPYEQTVEGQGFRMFPDAVDDEVARRELGYGYFVARDLPREDEERAPAKLNEIYDKLLERAIAETGFEGTQMAHNLVMVREWMLLVPRSKARIGKVVTGATGEEAPTVFSHPSSVMKYSPVPCTPSTPLSASFAPLSHRPPQRLTYSKRRTHRPWILRVQAKAIRGANAVVVRSAVLSVVGAVLLTPRLRVQGAISAVGDIVFAEEVGVEEVAGVVGAVGAGVAVVVGGVGLAGRGAEEGVVDAFEVFDAHVGVFALGVQGRVDGAAEFGGAIEARDGVGRVQLGITV